MCIEWITISQTIISPIFYLKTTLQLLSQWKQTTDGHGGGDWRLVSDWIQAVSQHNPALLTSTIEASIESHIMGFAVEKSRKQKKTMELKM